MKKGPIYIALREKKIVLFIVCLIIIYGLYSYYKTPKQEAPDITAPVAMLTTVYPGASPEDVEKLITREIENETKELIGYDYSYSYSFNSVSIVLVRLEYGVDVDEAWVMLRQKMEDLQPNLPSECQNISINTNLVDTAGIIISLSGDKYSYDELTNYAEIVKDKLNVINGISRFDIDGEQSKEVNVEIDWESLNSYNISLNEIINIIKAQNIEIPSGAFVDDNSKINVKIKGLFKNIDDIKNIIVSVSNVDGSIVRLGDIADINIEYKDSDYKIKHNNKNAVLLTGYFKQDKNIVIIGKKVEKKIKEIKSELPDDLSFDEVLYQPKDVSNSVNNFIINLLQGVLFVIIVVFIGMGFRNALVVSTAIPISILLTFTSMNLLGIKIHQISIAALIVALGMLVDNAIVVGDAIQNRIDQKNDKFSACINGVREVSIPILTSTLTTVAAFLPFLLLNSIAGEYISSLPKIVMIALISSYMVAIFVIPILAFIFFKESKKKDKKYKIRRIFDMFLKLGMKRRKTIIFLILVIVILTGFMVNMLGLQFFPKADKNIIYIDIKTEKNIDISNTEKLVNKVLTILDNQKEIISYTASIGSGLPKFYNTIPVPVSSPDVAQILIKLDLEKGNRFITNSEMRGYLQNKINEIITVGNVIVKELELAEPIESPIRVRITGSELDKLSEIKSKIRDLLNNINGTVNVEDDFSNKIHEYEVEIDNDKASFYGLTKYDIQNEISIAIKGREASVFRKDNKELNIYVKSNISSKEELEKIMIKSSFSGNKVKLKDIAKINLKENISYIKKYDGDYSVMVTSNVKSGVNPLNIQRELTNKLDELNIDDENITYDGELEKIKENFGSVGELAVISAVLIYLILLIQFKSFVQPIVILFTIPLSAIGSILGLYIFKQPISFTALLGMVSLMGIVVNNAIVLLDFINNERKKGKSIIESCMEASNKRFRPIILSSITTVIGLTPLALSGSELFRPMAISIMSGLLVSTILTLVIIPIVYNIVESKFEKYS